MDALTCPYTPSTGIVPPHLAGRERAVSAFEVLMARLEMGRGSQPMLLTGVRGTGKTSVLVTLEGLARERGWVSVFLETDESQGVDLRTALAARCRSALSRLSRRERWGGRLRLAWEVLGSFSLSAGPAQVEARGLGSSGVLSSDLTDLLETLGRAAAQAGRGVVLLLDEVQQVPSDQLGSLLQAVHRMGQLRLPVTVVAAGLPRSLGLVGRARSYGERMFQVLPVGNLDREAAWEAFSEPARQMGVQVQDLCEPIVWELTGGYPYAVQALGAAVWGSAEGNQIQALDVELAGQEYHRILDEGLYAVRLDRLTTSQRTYLLAMARLPEGQRTIARLEPGAGNPGVRGSLVRAGVIERDGETVAFTVPGFDSFVLRSLT